MENDTRKQIQAVDVKKVFYEKNPALAKLLPGFIYRYLRRIIHEDFINDFLRKHGDKQDLDFVNAAITEFNVTIKVEGEHNLPSSGKYIFASNHPLGGFDGLVIMNVLSRYYSGFKFLVNDILMNLKNLSGLFIPINKHGRQGIEAVKKIEELYNSDHQVLTFPAGYVSRRIKRQIVDLVWNKNFISKAVQHKRDIIPIHMSGRNTEFFYRLSSLRRFLGIKANLEMLYLVDETYKHRNKTLTVTFGEKIPWQTFDKSKRPIEWAFWLKKKVYALGGVNDIPL